MQIELKPWQVGALGVFAVSWGVQTWAGFRIIKTNDNLLKDYRAMAVLANRRTYLSMYLLAKFAESGIEVDEFEWHILHNPPKLFDEKNPSLFEEILTELGNAEDEDERKELARRFLERLREIREADEEN